MLIHYVDDSQNDIITLKRTLRDEKSVRIRSSERIDQITSFDNFESTDVFILDVFRPDAVSLESDVSTIRGYTDAPVLFLTGQNPDLIRDRARKAGAHAVLNKESLSPNLFMQFLEQACLQRHGAKGIVDGPDYPELGDLLSSSGQWPMPQPTLAASDEALAYIGAGLEAMTVGQTGNAGNMARMVAILRLVRQIGARQFSHSVLADASRIMADAFDRLMPVIRETGVKVTFDLLGNAPFWTVGARHDAESGLTALTEGMINLSDKGDWLHVDVSNLDTMTRIDFTSKRNLVSHQNELFRSTVLSYESPSYGLALLQSAAHLLGLRPEQIVISTEQVNRISVFL